MCFLGLFVEFCIVFCKVFGFRIEVVLYVNFGEYVVEVGIVWVGVEYGLFDCGEVGIVFM